MTILSRGGAVWQLVGLITRRSQVQILPPQPDPLTRRRRQQEAARRRLQIRRTVHRRLQQAESLRTQRAKLLERGAFPRAARTPIHRPGRAPALAWPQGAT